MPEEIIIEYLSGLLDVPVCAEVPEDMPERFVTVERTGSQTVNHVYTATMAIQSWGASMLDAARLNERVKALMDGITARPDVMRCHLNSDYNFTDTGTHRYRYQAVFDMVF